MKFHVLYHLQLFRILFVHEVSTEDQNDIGKYFPRQMYPKSVTSISWIYNFVHINATKSL